MARPGERSPVQMNDRHDAREGVEQNPAYRWTLLFSAGGSEFGSGELARLLLGGSLSKLPGRVKRNAVFRALAS